LADDGIDIRLSADYSELNKNINKANRIVDDFANNGEKSNKKFANSIGVAVGKTMVLVEAAKSASEAVLGFVESQIEAARETLRWSQRLDVAADKFSQLVIVGKKFGASTDDVGDSIKDLNERIADAATGTQTYESALNMVGLSYRDLVSKTPDEQFIKVADAIGKLTTSEQRNFVTAELMADAGFRLIPVFKQGEESIRSMMKAANESGAAFSSMQVKELTELDTTLQDLSISGQALGNSLLTMSIPALQKLAKWAKGAADSLIEFQKVIHQAEAKQLVKDSNDLTDSAVELKKELNGLREKAFWGDDKASARIEEINKQLGTMETQLKAVRGGTPLSDQIGTPVTELAPTVVSAKRLPDNGTPFLPPDMKGLAQAYDDYISLLEEQKQNENDIIYQYELEKRAIMEGTSNEYAAFKAKFDVDQLKREKNNQMAQRAIWESGWKGKADIMGGILGQMGSLMQTENRKMFETGKAAATANAVVEAITGASRAFSAMAGIPIVGPALGAAAAAAALAGGYARVQQIQSTTMGGGSTGGGLGGGGFGGSVSSAGGQSVSEAGSQSVQTTNFDVTLQGEAFSGEQIRNLIGQINDAGGDNFNVMTAGNK